LSHAYRNDNLNKIEEKKALEAEALRIAKEKAEAERISREIDEKERRE